MEEKKETRRYVREALELMAPAEREAASERIVSHVLALPEYGASQRVMLFASLPDEFDTAPLGEAALASGREVYLPRVDWRRRRLEVVRLHRWEDLREGYWGISEPPGDECLAPVLLDFILVPAAAFDRMGNRLGRGAGYYDRLLSTPGLGAVKCGAAFECQVLDSVPHEQHDVPVDLIVTEAGVYRRVKEEG